MSSEQHNIQKSKSSNIRTSESQLLAEEKWIVEALTKIRKQRNCLQIERLHLESMRGALGKKGKPAKSNSTLTSQLPTEKIPSTNALDIMQNKTALNCLSNEQSLDTRMDEDVCNEQELNLMVPSYHTQKTVNMNMEEEEEDEEDDVLIDMNMLMNGAQE